MTSITATTPAIKAMGERLNSTATFANKFDPSRMVFVILYELLSQRLTRLSPQSCLKHAASRCVQPNG